MTMLTYSNGEFSEFRRTGTTELIDARPRPIHWAGWVSVGFIGSIVEPQAGDVLATTIISSRSVRELDADLAARGLARDECGRLALASLDDS